jgi:putative Mg2+ transporter-C (MgtC) family protein
LGVPGFSRQINRCERSSVFPNRLPMTLDNALTWTDVVIRLLAATGIGGAIGLNRELTRKPAGLRTHALVALGSARATVSALQLGGPVDAHADAVSRVIQGVIAGIGFLAASFSTRKAATSSGSRRRRRSGSRRRSGFPAPWVSGGLRDPRF